MFKRISLPALTLGRPLVVRGLIGGRNRVDLNFFPPSADARADFWTGNGTELMRNALLFQ